ncbi:kinesin-like protein KIN-7B [Mangifera indica]|uniref:kinesin-like protein KIN-7B n=1 Tax=Mangifera indica TaxID=29780 RepID=UPI001CFB8E07|nr:kinesin-like protein KIN-7B [Mangifera indica]XP_044462943.1 kinesin-like protein KIN-7B [Mangifera indica]XP_044462944.1 kinesin-like protein KIN-7B [Mangifera indica]XP_044462945.1 kinesin-like protein KIN-7B [Mangifera indica]
MVRQSVTSTDPLMLMHEIRKLEHRQRLLGEEATRALEVLHNEVASHRLGSKETAESIMRPLSDIKDMQTVGSIPEDIVIEEKANLKEELTRLNSQGSVIASLERKLENVQKSMDILMSSFQNSQEILGSKTPEFKIQCKKKKMHPFSLNNSANMQNLLRSPCSPLSSSGKIMEHETENKTPDNNNMVVPHSNILPQSFVDTHIKGNEKGDSISAREGTPMQQTNSVDVKKMQRMFKNAAEENICNIRAYVSELKEQVAKLQYVRNPEMSLQKPAETSLLNCKTNLRF